MPEWIAVLNHNHSLKKMYIDKIKESVIEVNKLRDIESITSHFNDCDCISKSYVAEVDASTGEVIINLEAPSGLYNQVLMKLLGLILHQKLIYLIYFRNLVLLKQNMTKLKEL